MKKGPQRPRSDDLDISAEKELFKKQFLKMRENYENKIRELSVIKELADQLRLTVLDDQKTLLLRQTEIIRKYFVMEHIAVYLRNEESQSLETAASWQDEDWMLHPDNRTIILQTAQEAVSCNSPILTNLTPEAPGQASQDTLYNRALLCLPLSHNHQVIGVLVLIHPLGSGLNQNEVRFFSLVTDQIVTSILLSRLYGQMIKEERNRFLLSRFFSKRVTEEILANKGNLHPGGDRKRATIVFADLRGFTSFSEKTDQFRVVEILNAYFSHVTPIIFKNEGTLDKLLGDGILAVFGAPISHPHDPMRAIKTAIEIIHALRIFNEAHRNQEWPELKIGIGINTGDVVAGYIGSAEHINYTVIGDAVNVAQRIESIAGENEIIITKAVKDDLDALKISVENMKALRSLPAQKLRGKEEPVEIFRVEY